MKTLKRLAEEYPLDVVYPSLFNSDITGSDHSHGSRTTVVAAILHHHKF